MDGAATLLSAASDTDTIAVRPHHLRGGARERLGRAAADAQERRQEHLIGEGLAERDGETVRYRRNLLALLRRRELAAADERIARETGMAFVETRDGDRIEGV